MNTQRVLGNGEWKDKQKNKTIFIKGYNVETNWNKKNDNIIMTDPEIET